MKKLCITILLCLAMLTLSCSAAIGGTVQGYYIEYNQERFSYGDVRELEDRISEQADRMAAAHQMAEAARSLGYDDTSIIIQTAKSEYDTANSARKEYQAIHDDLVNRWAQKEQEYPAATYIWTYFKGLGYSDEVVAGLLGNMMVEVGGYTLNLKWNSQTPSYYGICQWNKAYSQIWGASLEQQCNFLRDTIKYELNTFGYCYRKGFGLSDFLNLSNPSDTALAFAKCYERCGSGTYRLRQECAITAYNYFMS